MTKPKTIREYIASKPEAARAALDTMYDCLKVVAPQAEEGIKWGTAAFTQKRILFTFAAFKNHVSLFPTPATIQAFEKELTGFVVTKGSIHFDLDKPLPKALVKKIARHRLKDVMENDAKWM